MGIKLSGVNVSGLIKKEIGDNMLKDPAHAVVLISFATGTRTGNLTSGKARPPTNVPGKGFIDETAIKSVRGTLVEAGDTLIQLVGDSFLSSGALVVPKINDHLTIEGSEYRIKELDRDPAAAMYICLCRGA